MEGSQYPGGEISESLKKSVEGGEDPSRLKDEETKELADEVSCKRQV